MVCPIMRGGVDSTVERFDLLLRARGLRLLLERRGYLQASLPNRYRGDLGCCSDAQLRRAPLCIQGGEVEGRGGNRDWPLSSQDGAALHRVEHLEGPSFCPPGESRL